MSLPSDGASDDLDLLDAWRAGDTQAGEVLVRRHYRTVYRFFFAKVDAQTCEDLTQLTFEALCRQRDAFRREAGLGAYVFGIARHKLLAHLRAKRRRDARFDPLTESCLDPEIERTLASWLGDRRQEHLVARGLLRLAVDDQILLELHDYEGLGRSELATVFDVPPGTIASRLRRARIKLRQQIEALAAAPDECTTSVQGLDSCMQRIRGYMDTALRRRATRGE